MNESLVLPDFQSSFNSPFSACFAPGVRILVDGHRYVSAHDLAVGCSLVARAEKAFATTTVTDIIRYQADRLVRINGSMEVTPLHPFLMTGGIWRRAKDLAIGDCLLSDSGFRRIRSIEWLDVDSVSVIDVVTELPFIAEGLITISKSVLAESRSLSGGSEVPMTCSPLLRPN